MIMVMKAKMINMMISGNYNEKKLDDNCDDNVHDDDHDHDHEDDDDTGRQ